MQTDATATAVTATTLPTVDALYRPARSAVAEPAQPGAARRASRGSTARLRSRWTGPMTMLLTVAVALAGCGGAEEPAAVTPPSSTVTDAADDDSTERVTDDLDSEEPAVEPEARDEPMGEAADAPALVARASDHLDVVAAPGSDIVTRTLPATTDFDSPTVLLINEVEGDWLHVLLPGRPNGATGWIHADDVEVSEVELHVKVDLDGRELTVLEAGEEVLTTTVAIGDADHPTPTGTFSITDKLDTGDPSGPYGPFALGLSARSDVLTEFAGGDGQVGIHGTNVPSSIGEAASHGCIRVDNGVIEQLAHLLPLGTPVTVS